MGTPLNQHWIVSVARTAGLEGADGLEIAADVPLDEAWRRTARHTGAEPGELAKHVADYYGLAVADLERVDQHAPRMVPAALARQLNVLALRCDDLSVTVATADPAGRAAEREIAQITGRSVRFQVAPPERLADAVGTAYAGDPCPPTETTRADPRPDRAARILVVDDDADSRTLLRTALEGGGYRVEEAPDGPEAIDILANHGPFDLVTLDLSMEKMRGIDVLGRMRSDVSMAGVPVIVATVHDDPAIAMELIEAGADDFVVKPVDGPRFLLRVQAVLRRRASGPFGL